MQSGELPGEEGSADELRGVGIITARGTSEGLVIRLDSRVVADELEPALLDFISSRRGFLSGNDVTLEWIGGEPVDGFVSRVSERILQEYGVTVRGSRRREADAKPGVAAPAKQVDVRLGRSSSERSESGISARVVQKRNLSSSTTSKPLELRPGRSSDSRPEDGRERLKQRIRGAPSTRRSADEDSIFGDAIGEEADDKNSASGGLFGGFDAISSDDRGADDSVFEERGAGDDSEGRDELAKSRALRASREALGAARDPSLWDDADTRAIVGTLRSGQRVESEHSVLVLGDVNSGAEISAGGDIIVLGSLRGVAHAGAYDETGGGRIILALDLQPTQLRIGSTISRGNSGSHKVLTPEVARVEGNLIVVEPYQARTVGRRR